MARRDPATAKALRLIRSIEKGEDATPHVAELLAMLPLWRERWLVQAQADPEPGAYYTTARETWCNLGRDAARALGRMTKPPLAALVALLGSADEHARAAALSALAEAARRGASIDAHLPAILALAGDVSPAIREELVQLIARVQPPPLVRVTALLESGDEPRRSLALAALVELSSEDQWRGEADMRMSLASVLPALAATRDVPLSRDDAARRSLLVGRLAEDDGDPARRWRETLLSPVANEGARVRALQQLQHADGATSVGRDALTAIAADTIAPVRLRARVIGVLSKLGDVRAHAAGFVALLKPLVSHENWELSAAALWALAELGDGASAALPELLALHETSAAALGSSTREPFLALRRDSRTALEASRATASERARRVIDETIEDIDASPEGSWSDFVATLPERFRRDANRLEAGDALVTSERLANETEDRETAARLLARASWESFPNEARLSIVRALAELGPAGGTEAVVALRRLVRAPSNDARAALQGLAAHGDAASSAAARVLDMFQQGDFQLEQAIEEALGAIGKPVRTEIDAITRGSDAARRSAALRILAALDGGPNAERLLALLEGPKCDERTEAAKQLLDMGEEARPHAARIHAVLAKVDDRTRGSCVQLLQDLGELGPDDLPRLVEWVRSRDQWLATASADAIGEIGEDAASAAGALVDALERSAKPRDDLFWAPFVWMHLMSAIAALGATCVPRLRELLDSRDEKIAGLGAWALAEIGPPAIDSLTDLERHAARAADTSPLQWHATEAICRIAGLRPSAERGLRAALTERHSESRIKALRMLAGFGVEASGLADAAADAAIDALEPRRRAACALMGLVALDRMDASARPALIRALDACAPHEDLGWLCREIGARHAWEAAVPPPRPEAPRMPDDVARRTRALLTSESPADRAEALGTIAKWRDAPGMLDQIVPLLDDDALTYDDEPSPAWEALEALGERAAPIVARLIARLAELDERGLPKHVPMLLLIDVDPSGEHVVPLLERVLADADADAHEASVAAMGLVRLGRAAQHAEAMVAALDRAIQATAASESRVRLALALLACGVEKHGLRLLDDLRERDRHVDEDTRALLDYIESRASPW